MHVFSVQVYNELSWFPAIIKLGFHSNATDNNNNKK